ncbi:MAG TPA: c-type cytochrome [Marinagarivorans sp.]
MSLSIKPYIIFMLALASTGCAEKAPEKVEPTNGELVFMGTCRVCHAQGTNGAPIYGNKKMWGKRITQGVPTLIEHAKQGYGLMPAKGGNTELSDQDIADAVRYMVAAVQD